jgi:hypothetical protein
MGHARLGRLPKTRTWQQVIDLIANGADVNRIAEAVMRASEKALSTVQNDAGFQEAVHLLTQLAIAASKPDPAGHLSSVGLFIPKDASLAVVALAVSEAMDKSLDGTGQRSDFGEMAQLSLVKSVTQHLKSQLPTLFATTGEDVSAAIHGLRKENAFGELSRGFFANMTNACMGYFLSKTLSTHIGEGQRFATTNQVALFEAAMKTHCAEASVIVEKFSAQWFSKHRFEEGGNISRKSAGGFGWFALEKIRSELRARSKYDVK